MRVLYLLNISNPDRLSADSGWIFADLLIPALVDAGATPIPLRIVPEGIRLEISTNKETQ